MLGLPPWLLIFPILGLIVLVHELGHFITAKYFGIKVLEFGFGFPPRIFGIPYKGTIYSVNWIPLGGFVRMLGEEDPTHPNSFAKQDIWKRALVLTAGSLMNFVLPIIIFTIMFMLPHDTPVSGSIIIRGVIPGSPAHESGLKPGDIILKINDTSVMFPDQLIDQIHNNLGEPTEVTYIPGTNIGPIQTSPELMTIEKVTLIPRINPPTLTVVETLNPSDDNSTKNPTGKIITLNSDGSFKYNNNESISIGYNSYKNQISVKTARKYNPDLMVNDKLPQGPLGISINVTNIRMGTTTEPIWTAIGKSSQTIWNILVFTKNSLTQGLSTMSNPGITGPIGIAQATGEGVALLGITWIFQLAAILSISLGVLNMLPIPALDGGRMMFVVIEWTRGGKRVSPKRENMVHLIGFAILIGLMIFISYQDIARLLNGHSLLG